MLRSKKKRKVWLPTFGSPRGHQNTAGGTRPAARLAVFPWRWVIRSCSNFTPYSRSTLDNIHSLGTKSPTTQSPRRDFVISHHKPPQRGKCIGGSYCAIHVQTMRSHVLRLSAYTAASSGEYRRSMIYAPGLRPACSFGSPESFYDARVGSTCKSQ